MAVALALCLVGTGCGSRRSHESLVREAQQVYGQQAASVGAAGPAGDGLQPAVADSARPGAETGAGATGTAAAVPAAGSAAPAAGSAAALSNGSAAAGAPSGATPAASSSAAAGPAPKAAAPARGASAGTNGQAATGPAGATTAAPGPGGSACTGSEPAVKIATVGEQSGVIGAFIRTGPQAVQAWVASVNARGGLNCHKLSYTVADDGGDPARNQSLTQRLVEQDGVVAFVHNNAPIAGQASVEYLKAKGVPVLGSETGSPWFYESPMHFPQSSSGDFALLAAIAGGATLGKPMGFTRLATFACVEVPICSRLTQIAPDGAKQFGLELVYQFSGSLAQPDYTSACLQARDAKANLIVAAFDPNSFSRLARSCEAVSYKPFYATGGPVANNDILKDPRLDGMAIGLSVIPQSVTGNAQADAFRTTMAQFAPGVPIDSAGFTGWVSAQMFARALRDVPRAGPVTSAQVLDGLWSLGGDDLGGITQPLRFTKGQPAPKTFCYFVGQVSGGKLAAPDNGQRRCA
ncbi:MAG TPA: ABC transporter substrate-binding protein [Acidimicrobiia bacterium]|nr:ABC transporter substrate-binding protein [Acidimicrobiia bacterium]